MSIGQATYYRYPATVVFSDELSLDKTMKITGKLPTGTSHATEPHRISYAGPHPPRPRNIYAYPPWQLYRLRINLEFPDRFYIDSSSSAAKIPCRIAEPKSLITAVEVGVLEYVRKNTSIPVPRVLLWCSSGATPVGTEYIIME
ncbi:hypothetical protein BDV12DRAFT_178021 [Aspergillus spectabilis]